MPERKKLEPLLRGLRAKKQANWWRQKSKAFRLWVVISLIWAVGVVIFVGIFDPFNNGWGYIWSNMSEEEFLKMLTVMVLPVLARVLFLAYRKFVE